MMNSEREWNESLDQLITDLNGVLRYAADSLHEAKRLRFTDYTDNPMQSEADYLDLTEFMDNLRISHNRAQASLKKYGGYEYAPSNQQQRQTYRAIQDGLEAGVITPEQAALCYQIMEKKENVQ